MQSSAAGRPIRFHGFPSITICSSSKSPCQGTTNRTIPRRIMRYALHRTGRPSSVAPARRHASRGMSEQSVHLHSRDDRRMSRRRWNRLGNPRHDLAVASSDRMCVAQGYQRRLTLDRSRAEKPTQILRTCSTRLNCKPRQRRRPVAYAWQNFLSHALNTPPEPLPPMPTRVTL